MDVIHKTTTTYECSVCAKKFKTEKAVKRHQRRECRRIWINLSRAQLNRLRYIVKHVRFEVPSWFSDAIGISLLESLGREFTKPDIEIVL